MHVCDLKSSRGFLSLAAGRPFRGRAGPLCQLSHKLIGFAPVPTSYLISLHIFTGINRFYITANGAHRKVGRSYIMLILLGAVKAIHYI